MRGLVWVTGIAVVSGFWLQGEAPAGSASAKVLGACRLEKEGLGCWDLAGKPDAALTEMVSRKASVEGKSLNFKFGKRARFVIVQVGVGRSCSFEIEGGSAIPNLLDQVGTEMLFAVSVPTNSQSIALTMSYWMADGQAAVLPFREGEKAVIQGVPIELGKATEGSKSSFPLSFYPSALSWSFGFENRGGGPPAFWELKALDREGKPIQFTDLWGKPVDAKTAAPEIEKVLKPNRDWTNIPTVGWAVIQSWPQEPAATINWYSMNIDPRWVSKLSVQKLILKKATLPAVPADPKG